MFDIFRKPAADTAPEAKASAVGPLTAGAPSGGFGKIAALHPASQLRWTARDSVSLTRAGFQGNPVGFRVVRMISEAAAALPLVLQDQDQRHDAHPLLALLAGRTRRRAGPSFWRRSMPSCSSPATPMSRRSPRPRAGCRASCMCFARPDVGGAGAGWLARGLRLRGERPQASLRHDRGRGADLPCPRLPSARRSLRPLAHRGGGDGSRCAQQRVPLVEGASGQCRAALGRHRLPGRGRAGADVERPVRAVAGRDGDAPSRRAQRRAADAAGGRA